MTKVFCFGCGEEHEEKDLGKESLCPKCGSDDWDYVETLKQYEEEYGEDEEEDDPIIGVAATYAGGDQGEFMEAIAVELQKLTNKAGVGKFFFHPVFDEEHEQRGFVLTNSPVVDLYLIELAFEDYLKQFKVGDYEAGLEMKLDIEEKSNYTIKFEEENA